MTRSTLLFLLAASAASACAAPAAAKKSYVPETQVTVKTVKRQAPEANYQVSPQEARSGSGGGAER